MGKTKLRLVEAVGNTFVFSNKYTDLEVPRRGELLKGLKLEEDDVVEITMKKLRKKK